jgi:hypothetical protein
MPNATYPIDAARDWFADLLPAYADWAEQASDVEIKESVGAAYPGGWAGFLAHHDDIKLVAE